MKENIYTFHKDFIKFHYYNFNFSSLHKENIITLDRINAVCFNTHPYSIIIDNKEIIFLNHNDKISLEQFVAENKIPISNHLDTWAALMASNLDTEFDYSFYDLELEKIGFSKELVNGIRKKVKHTISGTWEWEYLGLWDLIALKQSKNPFYKLKLIGKTFYWQTMEIALRGSDYDSNRY